MNQQWHCDYCESACSDKKWIAAHEKTCDMNPAVRACPTCRHSGFEWERGGPIFRCAKENPRKRMKVQRLCDKWEAKKEVAK